MIFVTVSKAWGVASESGMAIPYFFSRNRLRLTGSREISAGRILIAT